MTTNQATIGLISVCCLEQQLEFLFRITEDKSRMLTWKDQLLMLFVIDFKFMEQM